jgi:hypothetical protein
MNNIILSEKEKVFNHMGECSETGGLGWELFDMSEQADDGSL